MRHFSRVALALSLTSLGLVSCEKPELEVAPEATGTASSALRSASDSDRLASDYLASLTATLTRIVSENAEAKYVLGELALKRFDGDYDVAYKTLLEARVGGENFASLLTQEGFEIEPLAAGLTEQQANRLIISIPLNIENWASASQIKGTFIPVGVRDSELKEVTVYDAKGNTAAFSPDLVPLEATLSTREDEVESAAPFIVTSLGERLDENGQVRVEFTQAYQERLRLEQEALANTAARGGGRVEYLRGIKCDRLNVYEPGIRGEPEFRMYAASSYNNSFSTGSPVVTPYTIQNGTLFTGKRKKFDYGFDPNVQLFTWTTRFSDFYTVKWLEEDGGPTVTLTLNAGYEKDGIKFGGSTTVDFSRWENDDIVGEQSIHVQDQDWRYYIYSYNGPDPLFLTTMESR
ncbi:hypothetical protein [Hymenobacter metallicola]|uniref:Uncharacterized protein n=1 Tax=Hymenobacter metallicola TaxID=2563114 RepID=A0A4Z0QB90_9BACT|nr:hypothetical protein [Hymenobacter metallicola]TGE27300.1 hypothetical protein E5K02_12995 [Hymenobacter metallicola]